MYAYINTYIYVMYIYIYMYIFTDECYPYVCVRIQAFRSHRNLSLLDIYLFTPSHLEGAFVYTKPFQGIVCNIQKIQEGLKCLLLMQLSKNTWQSINVPTLTVL